MGIPLDHGYSISMYQQAIVADIVRDSGIPASKLKWLSLPFTF